jgi:hypothetical protein
MRIKFEKGMTPEAIAIAFVQYIKQNNIVIGSVNIYMQTYDEEMKSEKYKKHDNDYIICSPTETTRKEYENQVVEARRKRMKAVV